MLIVGLQGSPRLKGNSHYLLSLFMKEAEALGAETLTIDVTRRSIKPCMEYLTCEKNGTCPIKDEVEPELFPLFREADAIILATPMFFYSCSAQLKIVIDRTQALWARKYRLNITDPGRKWRRGFMLAVGATKGKNLFEGMNYTAKYFYDAVGAAYTGSLTYRAVEFPGDMEKHATVHEDVKKAVKELLDPLLSRKKILFVSRDDALLGQMASGFARLSGGDRFEVFSGGIDPLKETDASMRQVMQDKGIDMEYRKPRGIQEAAEGRSFDAVVYVDDVKIPAAISGNKVITWGLPPVKDPSVEGLKGIRDDIEKRIQELLLSL